MQLLIHLPLHPHLPQEARHNPRKVEEESRELTNLSRPKAPLRGGTRKDKKNKKDNILLLLLFLLFLLLLLLLQVG